MSEERRPARALPGALRAGQAVALVAPGGPVSGRRIAAAERRCRALGLEPVLGGAVHGRLGYLSGEDAARAEDLARAVADPAIAAVWAVRGGYGAMRILDRVDLRPLRRMPKPFIGFSDNTAIHLALDRLDVVSYHGPHAGAQEFPAWTEACFRRILFDGGGAGALPADDEAERPTTLREGVAEGRLAGGNLALLAALCGTPYALRGRGRIVVVEDVGEPVYRIDRMLVQLELAGCFDGAAGLAFGQFTEVDTRADERPLGDVLRERASAIGVPAVAGLPIGHGARSWTLPLGVRVRLDADARTLELLEPSTA